MPYRLRTLLQFRLGTLLLVVTVFCVWLGVQVNRANKQRRAIAEIEAARGVIHYDHDYDPAGQRIPDAVPTAPQWLRKFLGDDYFRKAVTVSFATEFYGRRKLLGLSKIDDQGLRLFESLPDVETLELSHNRAVTDAGLVHLRNLKKLRILYLYDCNVTGTGLAHLEGLPALTGLDLRRTPLMHDGFLTVARLKNLVYLGLPSSVTDDDLAALTSLTQLKQMHLEQTEITDAGLIHLESMTSLEEVTLPSGISDDALIRTKQALPQCLIGRGE
jgi:hypothetical protein